MYGFLRERRWVLGLIGAFVAAGVCVLLGLWQFERRSDRYEVNQLVQDNYEAPVAALGEVITPGQDLAREAQWLPVTVTGTYDPSRSVLVRNRTLAGRPGYEQLVPLRTGAGVALLVNRGFLPTGPTGTAPSAVPAPPLGPVEVLVRLRPTEPPTDRGAPAGQAARIDIPQLASELPYAVYEAYGVLASESPPVESAPTPLPRPPNDEGPHLSYSMQWFLFALVGFGLYGWLARREAQERAGGATSEPSRRARHGPRGGDAEAEDAEVEASVHHTADRQANRARPRVASQHEK